MEGEKHFEGVVPKNWILEEEKILRWPKHNARLAHKKKTDPQEDWETFTLVKIKMTSGMSFPYKKKLIRKIVKQTNQCLFSHLSCHL